MSDVTIIVGASHQEVGAIADVQGLTLITRIYPYDTLATFRGPTIPASENILQGVAGFVALATAP